METGRGLIVRALQTLAPGRIGEINLLLDALSEKARSREITCRVISQMAAKCDRIIQPEQYITLGLELGIIYEEADLLCLTILGKSMLANATWPPQDLLNSKQQELISPELLGHPEIINTILTVLGLMRWIPESSIFLYPRSIRLTSEHYLAFRLLQIAGFAAADDSYITMTEDNFGKLSSILGLGSVLARSEDDLWESLRETNERARAAEEFVVEYERQRLIAANRHDLSIFVDRVSESDVQAGFDIRSFETDGTTRYIEVKSSTSLHIQFFWTSTERNFAITRRDSYWIYFVPRAQELRNYAYEIVKIKDPIQFEGKCLDLEPASYKVTLISGVSDTDILQA